MAASIFPKQRGWTKPQQGVAIQWGHPLADGLVGCWLFNEQNQNFIVDLARHNNGTLTNTPTWRSGLQGSELDFASASDEYVNIGNPLALQITGSITIATSYRLTTVLATQQLVTKDKDTGGRAYTLDIVNNAGFGVRFYINGGSGTDTNLAKEGRTAVAGDDQIVHAVYNQAVPKLYLFTGGVQRGVSGTTDASIPTATANVLFARREYAGFTEPLNGQLRFVFIWNRALQHSEVAWHAAEPYVFCVPQAPTQRYWVQAAAAGAEGGGPRTFFAAPVGFP